MKGFEVSIHMVECDKCKRGWSINDAELNNLSQQIKCGNCGNEFTILEGIKNSIKSENTFSLLEFVSTATIVFEVKFKVGYAQYIELPKDFNKIYKVIITPEKPCYVEAVKISSEGFLLMSSCDVNSTVCTIGGEVEASVSVFGKSTDYNEPWRQLLAYSREHYISGGYLTSILLSEIAFESFIDNSLLNGYLKQGIDEGSISRFLIATDMPIKVNPLMFNVYRRKLKDLPSYNIWEKKILKWRNSIAHGNKLTASKEEAKLTFDTIIDAIFYLNEAIHSEEK